MHYGEYAFSIAPGKKKTIEAKNPNVELVEPFQKFEMEESDAKQINNLYASECARRN